MSDAQFMSIPFGEASSSSLTLAVAACCETPVSTIGECATTNESDDDTSCHSSAPFVAALHDDGATSAPRRRHERQQDSGMMSNADFRRAIRALQKKVDRLKEQHLELFEENMRLRQEWVYLEAEVIARCTGQTFPLPKPAKRRPSIQYSSRSELMERARKSVGQFKEALASIRKSR